MGKLDDALRMATMPSGMGAISQCEHVLMREVMSCVIGNDGDEATRLEAFTHAIQLMCEDEFYAKVGLVRTLVTDIVPHALAEASGYDDANALAAIEDVQIALSVIRHAKGHHNGISPDAKHADHAMHRYLVGAEDLGWSLAYVNSQLRLLADGVRGIDLADHTCTLLMESNAYKV